MADTTYSTTYTVHKILEPTPRNKFYLMCEGMPKEYGSIVGYMNKNFYYMKWNVDGYWCDYYSHSIKRHPSHWSSHSTHDWDTVYKTLPVH